MIRIAIWSTVQWAGTDMARGCLNYQSVAPTIPLLRVQFNFLTLNPNSESATRCVSMVCDL